MKNLLVLSTILFFSLSFNPQDEDKAGWYADGVKVTSINCYSFKKLQLVVPYNSEWASYTQISLKVYHEGASQEAGGIKLIPVSSINGFVKGKYFVFNFLTPGEKPHDDGIQMMACRNYEGLPSEKYAQTSLNEYNIYRWGLKYERSSKKEDGGTTPDKILYFQLFGLTQTGVEEKFDQVCNCIKKEPIYTSTKLGKKNKLTFTNRETVGRKTVTDESAFTVACTYDGEKFDIK